MKLVIVASILMGFGLANVSTEPVCYSVNFDNDELGPFALTDDYSTCIALGRSPYYWAGSQFGNEVESCDGKRTWFRHYSIDADTLVLANVAMLGSTISARLTLQDDSLWVGEMLSGIDTVLPEGPSSATTTLTLVPGGCGCD